MAVLHVPLSTLRHSPRGPSTHDLGPPWIATPSMSGVLIPFLMPVHPGAFPTFHARAQTRLAPPICRTPPGQSAGTPQTCPGAQLLPRFRRHWCLLRHVISGSLTLAFLTHT